jgi:hypothetical protein
MEIISFDMKAITGTCKERVKSSFQNSAGIADNINEDVKVRKIGMLRTDLFRAVSYGKQF